MSAFAEWCGRRKPGLRYGLVLAMASACALPQPALAQEQAAPPQESVTEELIRLLAEHNALSKQDAEGLIKRLQAEQAQRQAAPQQAQSAAPAAPAANAAPAATAAAPQPEPKKGDVRVIYIPESEKQKIREQVKQEVLATAKAENWAQPNALPDWLNRISFYGDFRYRQEFDLYQSGNSPFFIDYQAINAGPPFDTNAGSDGSGAKAPTLNTTQNREQPRFRLRLGVDGKVADDLSASFRFASGNTTNPVSSNQTLGSDFNKYTFVIDQAYLDYHPGNGVQAWLGRMPKPWISTNLVWYDDLSFDGVALRYERAIGGFKPFLTVGAFSVENTALNFPATGPSSGVTTDKVASRDKWLYAAQAGLKMNVIPDVDLTSALAYYYFYHLEGATSSPCQAVIAADSCDTDNSRPGFIQKGNTVFALRNLDLTGSSANPPSFQYFGLASPFRELDAVVSVDWHVGGPIHAIFTGDYDVNLAYDKKRVTALGPLNNFSPDVFQNGVLVQSGTYNAGNQAFQLQALVGYPVVRERWQWSVLGGYKRVESDAVVDAFDDPDFGSTNGVGGTNLKGYFIHGSLGLTHNTWFQARWFSASQVTALPLSADTVQLDLNARF